MDGAERISNINPHNVTIAPNLCSDCERVISVLNLSRVVIFSYAERQGSPSAHNNSGFKAEGIVNIS